MRIAAAPTSKRAGLKTAFICPDQLAYGMIRMYQLQVEDPSGVKANVFRDRPTALQWVGGEAGDANTE